MMTVVTGASSSGKSSFAEQCLVNMGEKRRIYVATMIAWDEECRARIKKHRAMRREKRFETIECPVDLWKAEIPERAAVLLECMSNLAANEMYREEHGTDGEAEDGKRNDGQIGRGPDGSCGGIQARAEAAKGRILAGLCSLREQAGDLVIVTNEIFDEPALYGEETESYRKLLGELNQEIFSMADEVYEVVFGIPILLKGAKDQECERGESVHMTIITGGAYQGKAEFARRIADAAGAGLDGKNGARTEKNDDAKLGEKLGSGCECESVQTADGRMDTLEAAFECPLILNFHEYIRRFSNLPPDEAKEKMRQFVTDLIEKNPAAILTADEIGSGIVPLSSEDRLWRDLEGEAIQTLSREAARVYRVIGGIPQLLKGRKEDRP